MIKREPKQSLLDYLWVNFGKLTVPKEITEGTLITLEEIDKRLISELSIVGQTLIGSNAKGDKITEVKLPITSEGGLLLQGKNSDSLVIEVTDNIISGRLKINNKPDSQIKLIETDKGVQVDFDESFKEKLTLIENISEDLTALKADVKSNKDALEILNGDENKEGSVLNLINNSINSAFLWKNLN